MTIFVSFLPPRKNIFDFYVMMKNVVHQLALDNLCSDYQREGT